MWRTSSHAPQRHTDRPGRMGPALLVDRQLARPGAERRHLRQRALLDVDPSAQPHHRLPSGGVGSRDEVLALGDEAPAVAPAVQPADVLEELVVVGGDHVVEATKRAPLGRPRRSFGLSVVLSLGGSRRLSRLAGGLGKSGEGLGIAHGDVGQDLAVELDAGQLQAVHELAVAEAVLAGGRVDAGDPEAAEVTLAVAPIAVRVGVRLHQRFLGALVVRLRLAAEALGALERGTALLLGVDGALDPGHLCFAPRSVFTRGASWSEISMGLRKPRLRFGDFFSRM